ncbi:MAG: RluA family pseudouridine synthase [Bacteroidetes bacterium]|nr:RluA family pseudouridine synthase [Bacteroidota bacterium]
MEEENKLSFEEEPELFEHHRIEVDKGQALLRIDKFLLHKLAHASRTKIQVAADAGNIRVNNHAVKSNYKVKPFDVITIVLPHPPKNFELIPQHIPLDIVYEDADILIVNKAAGMVVHPAFGHDDGTLVNALLYYFENLPAAHSKVGTNIYAPRPGLVHRIDKNTSGILIVAKNEAALTFLGNKFFHHDLTRKYLTLVWGNVLNDEGTITAHVGRNQSNRKLMDVFTDESMGKRAVTHYKVLERFGYVTLVECTLETGRTHQIRVHLKSIGHRIFNDADYGGNQILKGMKTASYKKFVENCFELCPRQALHAALLEVEHPVSKKNMRFTSALPDDMQQLIDKWRKYSNHKALEE